MISIRLKDLNELLLWAANYKDRDTNFEHGKQLEMEFDVDILPSRESAVTATESTTQVTSTDTITGGTRNVQSYSGYVRSAIRQPTDETDSE